MDEEDTFRKLKRIPFADMHQQVLDSYNSPPSISPVYKLGSSVVERSKFYHPMMNRHFDFIRILEEGNWTVDDFAFECEKKAIIEQVEEYNQSIEFPQDVIDRAKQFFPNLKFTPAKLELE